MDNEIRRQLLEPIIAATRATLAEMAGIDATVRDILRTPSNETSAGHISVVLGLNTNTDVLLVLSFPEPTASALARRVLKDIVDKPDDGMVRDCLAEIANVIGGQAKTLLAETPYRFAFTLPQIVTADSPTLQPSPAGDRFVIVFASDVGEFAVECIRS